MNTYMPKPDEITKDWFIFDADGKTLGRAAARIATVLRGKHKAVYSPSVDTGDFVIVVNAGKVAVTGNKLTDKVYYHHTNYPGGIRSITLENLLEKDPEEAIKKAVKGMLPKGTLGREMFKKLKVYAAAEHPHQAQQPRELTL